MPNPSPKTFTDRPPLAQYRPLRDWAPRYGDYVIWAGWLSCWHGLVTDLNPDGGEVIIVFAGVPYLLFTMDESEQLRETRNIKLATIRTAASGTFAVQQHDFTRNAIVWFI